MIKVTSFLLSAVVALGSVSSAQAATLSRIFSLRFETTTADFMGLGALPTTLSLIATLDDATGNFAGLRLYNGDLGLVPGAPLINTFDSVTSFWAASTQGVSSRSADLSA